MTEGPKNSVLLTGASGFLGGYILQELAHSAYEVTAAGRHQVAGCRFIRVDFSSSDLELEGQSFYWVVHAAGKAHFVPKTDQGKEIFSEINVNGTKSLLKALEKVKNLPKAFVFISTVAVYGLEEESEVDEETPLKARDPYGLSKLRAEDEVVQWCERNDVLWGIMRLPLVVGKNPPGNLGAMIGAIKRGHYLGIGKGEARKSMVLAKDVGRLIPKLAKRGGVYNLTDGYHPSLRELEDAISGCLDRKISFNLPYTFAQLAARCGDGIGFISGKPFPLNSRIFSKLTRTITFSDQKARRDLNWKPRPVLDHVHEMFC